MESKKFEDYTKRVSRLPLVVGVEIYNAPIVDIVKQTVYAPEESTKKWILFPKISIQVVTDLDSQKIFVLMETVVVAKEYFVACVLRNEFPLDQFFNININKMYNHFDRQCNDVVDNYKL